MLVATKERVSILCYFIIFYFIYLFVAFTYFVCLFFFFDKDIRLLIMTVKIVLCEYNVSTFHKNLFMTQLI